MWLRQRDNGRAGVVLVVVLHAQLSSLIWWKCVCVSAIQWAAVCLPVQSGDLQLGKDSCRGQPPLCVAFALNRVWLAHSQQSPLCVFVITCVFLRILESA